MRYLEPAASAPVPFFGSTPLYMTVGAACAMGSVASDYAHSLILPHILYSERMAETESLALEGIVGAAAPVAALAAIDARFLDAYPTARLAGVGVAAEMIGGAVFHRLVSPIM